MSENIVKLDVGGTIFKTTKSTLTKFDGMFRTMFETDVPVEKSASGDIFIDRDPTHFRIILNFMRDGDVNLPETEKEVKEISREAQYYLLEELVELCSSSLQKCKRSADSNTFKLLRDHDDVVEVVANSDKPVLIVLLASFMIGTTGWIHDVSEWKQFIQKHEDKWNIFFKANSENELDWKFYTNKNYNLENGREKCRKMYKLIYDPQTQTYIDECFYPKTIFHHLEYHMNIYLNEIIDH